MGDYVHRVVDAVLGTAFMPAFMRHRLMRAWGFDLAPDACIWSGASFRSRRISIGSQVFINVGFFYDGAEDAIIENNVRIGQFVRLITATHEIGPPEQRCCVEALARPIRIEKGCWIGAAVTILPGVTIRSGCVIAAGAVVLDSTERNGLYAGVPARLVRKLADTRHPRGDLAAPAPIPIESPRWRDAAP